MIFCCRFSFCGTSLPPHVFTTSNALFLRFTSDTSVGLKGFTASYREVTPHGLCWFDYFHLISVFSIHEKMIIRLEFNKFIPLKKPRIFISKIWINFEAR